MIVLPNVTLFEVGQPFKGSAECLRHCEFAGHVALPAFSSYRAYNEFMIKELKDVFTTSHILTVQADGFVVNPARWTDEFLAYDYIGATMWMGMVGNGGFSLRSKRFCEISAGIELTSRNPLIRKEIGIDPKDVHNEDLFLCIENRDLLETKGARFAPPALADRFAWEVSPIRPRYSNAFGFHSPATLDILTRQGIIK